MPFDPLPPSGVILRDDSLVQWLATQTIPIQKVTDLDTLTDKATPVDADEIWVADSEDDNASKKISLGSLPSGGAHTIAVHSDTTATGTELEELTDGSETTLHSHAGSGAHTVASHSDTTGTGTELETLTDGSNADSLHTHTGAGTEMVEVGEEGVLITAVGSMRWYPPFDITLVNVAAFVGTAPTGATILVDVHKNGTTIFTTQSNRPTIATSGFHDVSGTPDVTGLTGDTDYLTFDIDQVGSTIAGADLVIQVRWTRD